MRGWISSHVAVLRPAFARAALVDAIAVEHVARGNRFERREFGVITISPETALSAMTAAGYTEDSGSDWLGYVYPNSGPTPAIL